MNLTIHWLNATRPEPEKNTVQEIYRGYLVNHFGTVGAVCIAKQDYERQSRPPNHPFPIAWMKGHYLATRHLSPSEAAFARFNMKVEV